MSLESLVHCCLLESLGFQRPGSLLEKKKSEHVAILFIYIYFFGGGGVFNFLAA